MLNLKIIATNDVSKTLKIPEWNEHYHSTHGAISEAQYVYIKNGLDLITSYEISIFEMGFGTGLNTFLSYLYGLEYQRNINYYVIEKEPLSLELVNQLNYVDLLGPFSEEHIFIKFIRVLGIYLLRFQLIFIYIKYTTPFRNMSLTPLLI